MRPFFTLVLCFSILTVINGAPSNKNSTSTVKTEIKTATTIPLVKKDTIKEEKLKKLQGYEGFGYETDDSGEKNDEDSGIDFIPVSLQHPLFKVFGINPDEYVVYYKYHRDQDHKFDPRVKFNEVDRLGRKETYHKSSKKSGNKLKRSHRHTPILELDRIDDYDYDLEEIDEGAVELVPVHRVSLLLPSFCHHIYSKSLFFLFQKRSYDSNSMYNFQSPLYPSPQQQQPFPYYPAPIYPPYYQYPQPFPYSPCPCQCPSSPCPYNIPTCPQLRIPCHPYQFYQQPGTYRQLTGAKNVSVQYPDGPRDAMTRRKRSKNIVEILKKDD